MRGIKIVFLAIVGVLLVLPGLQMFFPLVRIASLEEYRRLTPFPDLSKLFNEEHARLAPSINKWFDDNVGFRGLLTRISNQVDYSIFGYSRNVLIGWHGRFYEPIWTMYQVDQEREGEKLQEKLRTKIVAIANYLARRNIKLVVVSIPLSASLYPQYLPASAPRIPHPSQMEKFGTFLKGQSDIIYVDGMDTLSPHTAEDLFFKTDPHYNPVGGYLMARAVVHAIAMAEGRESDPWERQIHFVPFVGWSGAFSRFLAVFNPPVETFIGNDAPSSFDEKHPPPGQSLVVGVPPFEAIYHNDPRLPDRLPPMLLYGNSFSDWWESLGLYECFSAVYRVRGKGDDIAQTLRAIPPGTRYLVFQYLAPYLDAFTYATLPSD